MRRAVPDLLEQRLVAYIRPERPEPPTRGPMVEI
jgi:hypothetical protein